MMSIATGSFEEGGDGCGVGSCLGGDVDVGMALNGVGPGDRERRLMSREVICSSSKAWSRRVEWFSWCTISDNPMSHSETAQEAKFRWWRVFPLGKHLTPDVPQRVSWLSFDLRNGLHVLWCKTQACVPASVCLCCVNCRRRASRLGISQLRRYLEVELDRSHVTIRAWS